MGPSSFPSRGFTFLAPAWRMRILDDYREPGKVPPGKKGMLWSLTYRATDRTLRRQAHRWQTCP